MRRAGSAVRRAIASAVSSRSGSMSCRASVTSRSSGKERMSASSSRVKTTLPAPRKAITVMARILGVRARTRKETGNRFIRAQTNYLDCAFDHAVDQLGAGPHDPQHAAPRRPGVDDPRARRRPRLGRRRTRWPTSSTSRSRRSGATCRRWRTRGCSPARTAARSPSTSSYELPVRYRIGQHREEKRAIARLAVARLPHGPADRRPDRRHHHARGGPPARRAGTT